ncbi:hypothetical protein HDV05_008726 [Chytridiales sp. JEL 0842]|nr:hypothetical protein HDV05_008726 [Chytridiales sp. JEL 0842]
MGFLMGGLTGSAVGFLVGSMTVLRYGPGEKGYLATVGSQMLQTGGFLGFIMGVGMLLRGDSEEEAMAAYRNALRGHQQKRSELWGVHVLRRPKVTIGEL